MIDFDTLNVLVQAHGEVIRLVLAETKGSTPRDAGTDMVIWTDGHHGTIGGGRLEYEAIKRARAMLDQGSDLLFEREALGPGMGQCCGGAVSLVFERFDVKVLKGAQNAARKSGIYLRRVGHGTESAPSTLASMSRLTHLPDRPVLGSGWLAERISRTRLPVFIYGAGHVGRALATALAPLPQFEIHLADVRQDQFDDLPDSIHKSWEILPTDLLASAPDDAAHFIMTPEHDYDLELCHRLLSRSFGYAGLIGSETKWARFRSRLEALGHAPKQIARIRCPIGDPSLGKHPQEIALGVVLDLLRHASQPARAEASTS